MRWLGAAVVLILTSCAPASPTSPVSHAQSTPKPSPSSVATGPRLTGTISVAGGVRLTSTFSVPASVEVDGNATPAPAASTCADYARGFDVPTASGGGKGFHPPEFQSDKVNHETMYLSVSMPEGYAGPGAYDSRINPSLQGYFAQNIDNPMGVATTPFSSSIHGATLLTVNPDGSGSLDLVNWGSTEVHGAGGAGGVSVSGTVKWTCHS